MRTDILVCRACWVVLLVAAGLELLSPLALGQQRDADAAILRQAVIGRVLMPDGSPAPGAVVVTSAGGRAVTGADGRFELAVSVPLDAESLEVTAVAGERAGSGDLVARVSIVPASLSPRASVGVLVLAQPPDCLSRWLPTFGLQPGVNDPGTVDRIKALAVFDDGSGPALYVGGEFTSAGGASAKSIAKWDGSSWSALDGGLAGLCLDCSAHVNALVVFDDGSGPALYAAGRFSEASGLAVDDIAKWDGSSWAPLGTGPGWFEVFALTVFDDGTGPALFAGGDFGYGIRKWDGMSWSVPGGGMNGGVDVLTVFDDGNGPALYVGGTFTLAGGTAANRIAKWDGSSWSALGSGMDEGVGALTVHDDGSGPSLYAGGDFATAGGVAASRIAKWNGSTWSALGSGVNATVNALVVYDEGSGPALYAGGGFTSSGAVSTNRIAKWDGSSWSAVGSLTLFSITSNAPWVLALAVYDEGSGPALYAGGHFKPGSLAKWDGSSWSTLGNGIDEEVRALVAHDDVSGQALYVGGVLTSARGVVASRIAKWDGSTWSALGSGLELPGANHRSSVDALAVYDDGGGPSLYAGGRFALAGGVSASQIARWDGSSWAPLGNGISGSLPQITLSPRVLALGVFDDGSGPALYVGGDFTTAGVVTANRVARWDGSSWSALGSGMNDSVLCLAVYDDGGGPRLYAGGYFTTAGGVAANKIARWDGSGWSAVGGGMDKGVLSLLVHDDGGGPALYAAGTFTTAGGVTTNGIARWDGTSWSPLGTGFGPAGTSAMALAVYDEGAGPELIVGGAFTSAGGVAANRIATWDGASWSALGSGMAKAVLCLAVHDDGSLTALYAGGRFLTSPARDSYLAKWACRPKPSVKRRQL